MASGLPQLNIFFLSFYMYSLSVCCTYYTPAIYATI